MDPLYFLTVAETKCFVNRIKGSDKILANENLMMFYEHSLTENWKYNYNYWTGGFKYNESDIPQWSMDNSTIEESLITWALDKKPAFNCLQYKINDTSGNRSVSWSYKNCSSKFVAACRVLTLLLKI
jgi:hypothetical protein